MDIGIGRLEAEAWIRMEGCRTFEMGVVMLRKRESRSDIFLYLARASSF